MLYKSKILTLVTMVYSMVMSIVYGPKWPFLLIYIYIYIYIYLLMLMIGTGGS